MIETLTDVLRRDLRGFGVRVLKVSFSDFFRCDVALATWKPEGSGQLEE